ncbi:G-protein coupled receptor family C group 5 member D-like isoform X1 [Denticeps clupeoides]|uniref:G-protein coupled receptors family 3 profile domain-containing protein n=1 Tax=Denticeps clupeoides TaxID=299321 RepID=A0A8C4BL74_9TELE|nr:G-protein coupled receptor family C group 5 member D-like isoform X1 [Denticeps clupeoides]
MASNHYQHVHFLLLLLVSASPMAIADNSTVATNLTTMTPSATTVPPAVTTSGPLVTTPLNSTVVPGCRANLDRIYFNLCDRQAVWGIVVESLASVGFLLSLGLFLGLLFWSLWVCACRPGYRRVGLGGKVAAHLLFLMGTAGVFAITFAFVVQLTPQTCPVRVFMFGVLFAMCFSSLASRCLALLGFSLARGWGEITTATALSLVQVIIATEWLVVVLVRDKQPCGYTPAEFAMLLIYVLFLLAVALMLSLWLLNLTCGTHSYAYSSGSRRQAQVQAGLMFFTLLLCAGVWVAWISMLTRGDQAVGRSPAWDDPVLSVGLVASGWVLLLGHGLGHLGFLCRCEGQSKERLPDFSGWTTPSMDLSRPPPRNKEGKENCSFEGDGVEKKVKKSLPVLRSPYESGFSMTEIDPSKDYTIPRPQTTNMNEPYDDYYGSRLEN